MRKNDLIMKVILPLMAALGLLIPQGHAADGALGRRFALDNGMVLLLAERHAIPMVTVNMAIAAGGTAEPADRPGLASLTASLLMQGTARRTAEEISREIDFVGGSLSVSADDDFAFASLRILKKDLATGFDLLADVLMNPVFDQKEIDRKVQRTLAELRRRKEDPASVASEAFSKALFGAHPYGRTDADVAAYLPKVTRQHLLAFYRARYSPNHAVIAVVGDVTDQEVTALLQSCFQGWKQSEEPMPALSSPPEIARTFVEKIDRDVAQANIAMGHVGIRRENPDFHAVVIMNQILGGGGFTSRLMDNIRENRGLAYDVHSVFAARKEPGSFQVWVQTKNESANEAIAEIFKEVRRIRTERISEKELADAKAYLTGSFPLRLDTYAKIASMITNIEIYHLGLDYPLRYRDLVNAVTREDVLRVAKQYLDPDRMAIVVVANQQKAQLK